MQSAAGGTIHRLKPGLATVCDRSRNERKAIVRILPVELLFCAPKSDALTNKKMCPPSHQAGKRNPSIAVGNEAPERWEV
jgi:hypothetical protein